MTANRDAFQDRMHDNFCFGCGADNPDGLQLKSAWGADDPEVAVAQWTPGPVHAAGPRHILNGGIIATLLDCHGICTAVADAYRREGRDVGSDPDLWYATASMQVDYLRPTPIDEPVDADRSGGGCRRSVHDRRVRARRGGQAPRDGDRAGGAGTRHLARGASRTSVATPPVAVERAERPEIRSYSPSRSSCSSSASCTASTSVAGLRCLRHSRNGGMKDTRMITAMIG